MTSVSALVIARNEERCIERALRSVRSHVDEVIVLDTGSTDRTPQLARECGARVEAWTWRDNFAQARNAAISLSTSAWNLFLDADEWLTDGADALRRWPAAGFGRVGLVEVRSTYELGGEPVMSATLIDRLLPAGIRYEGRVHERPVHDLPAVASEIVLDHDGYEPEVFAAKRGRNEQLLRLELHDAPADPYLHYQLGKELEADERFAEGIDAYRKAYESGQRDAPWRHSLVVRFLYVLKKAQRFSEAMGVVDAELVHWADSPDFAFTVGDLFLDMALADPSSAGDLLPLVEQSWLAALDIGDRADLPGSVRGRGSYLAAHNLAAYYATLGQPQHAERYARLERRLRRQRVPARG